MADFTQNISNTVRAFAAGPSSKWNAHNWGAFNWGEGTVDIIHDIGKLIENAPAFATTLAFDTIKVVSNALNPTEDLSSETMTERNGWNYIFPSPSIDAENRNLVSWTQVSSQTVSWTCVAAGSTTWS